MIANILADDLRWATVTDYAKFFLYIKHYPPEIASNCVRYRGHYFYFYGKVFGARSTPFSADALGDLLQQIQQHSLDEIAEDGPTFIARRTDDQAILCKSKRDANHGARAFEHVTSMANVAVQTDKQLTAVQLFKFDGFLWDLLNGQIGVSLDKRLKLKDAISRVLRSATRKECEQLQGLLEWITMVLLDLRPLTVAFRASWMAQKFDTSKVTISPTATKDLNRFQSLAEQADLWVRFDFFFATATDMKLYSDGSGHGGMGAFMLSPKEMWISHKLADTYNYHVLNDLKLSSTWVEVAALLAALHAFRPELANSCVEWWTDSEAAVNIFHKNRSKQPTINHLVAHIALLCTLHNIKIVPYHHKRDTPLAQIADDLSKFKHSSFSSQQTKVPASAIRVIKNSTLASL
jgi:ribonuclease HI